MTFGHPLENIKIISCHFPTQISSNSTLTYLDISGAWKCVDCALPLLTFASLLWDHLTSGEPSAGPDRALPVQQQRGVPPGVSQVQQTHMCQKMSGESGRRV